MSAGAIALLTGLAVSGELEILPEVVERPVLPAREKIDERLFPGV